MIYAVGVPALRILCLTFLPACISILLSSAFQALGIPSLSLWLTLFRQVLLLFPTRAVPGCAGGPSFIWYAFLVSEGIPCIAAMLLYHRVCRDQTLRAGDRPDISHLILSCHERLSAFPDLCSGLRLETNLYTV